MKRKQAEQMGVEHAKAGKQCTPFDCQQIDKILLEEAKNHPTNSQAKEYAKLRGAFNAGWQKQYFAQVSQ